MKANRSGRTARPNASAPVHWREDSPELGSKRQQDLTRALVESTPDSVVAFDRELRITEWNPASERNTGLVRADVLGRSIFDVLPVLRGTESEGDYERALDGETFAVTDRTFSVLGRDEPSFFDAIFAPLRDASGSIVGGLVVSRDVTERRRGEETRRALTAEQVARREAELSAERFRFLAEAGAVLSASLDDEEVAENLAQLSVAVIADWCAVCILDASGTIVRSAVAHADPAHSAAAEQLRAHPPHQLGNGILAEVLRQGQSVLLPSVTREALKGAERSEPWSTIHALGARSWLGVPLIAQGRCLGAVLFVLTDRTRPNYGPADVALGEELARHAANALTHARLYSEVRERQAELAAQAGELRQTTAALELANATLRAQSEELARARDKADKARARVATILESISDAFLAVDLGWRLTYVNQEAQRLMHRPARELIGKRLSEHLLPGVGLRFSTELARAMDERVTVSFVDFYAPLSSWFEVRAFPSLDGLAVYFRDITAERHAAEEQRRLQESLRLSETMSAIGAVAGGVAHEVRNPLFAISATLDALQLSFPDRTELQPFVAQLTQQVERMRALMTDLLEYGKPSVGERAPVPLGQVLAKAIAYCEPLAARARVALCADFDSDVLPAVTMDRARLVRVFQNLIENAIQHSTGRGQVRLTAEVNEREGVTWAECAVADSGPGIALADLPRLFEPFFTKRHGGTGLGLSIVQRIVREHGGTVTAANGLEAGAVMTVCLPAASAG